MVSKGCTGYRFDPFEVDLGTGRLLRNGHTVRIQRLPFQMLVALLEHAGRPVSRDELRSELWSDRTFLEFDNNLRVAAVKLREALGDQATDPRFIQTVARQGYQFIGDARAVFADDDGGVTAATDAVAPEPARVEEWRGLEAGPESDSNTGNKTGSRSESGNEPAAQGRWFWVRRYPLRLAAAGAGALVLAVLSFAAYRYAQRPLNLGDESVVVGDVSNATGDPVFNGVLSSAFRLKMQESPYLNLIEGGEFGRLMEGGRGATVLERELWACRRVGAAVFLDGRMTGQAGSYALVLHAWRCDDGSSLKTVRSEPGTRAEVLPSLDEDIENMRLRLGEPERLIGRYNVPLTQATTSSLLAFKAYSLGEEKHRRGEEEQSVSDFKLAIDLDPQFALAYASLGTAYMNMRNYAEARADYSKAYALRGRTTERERLYIAAQYSSFGMGDIDREIEAYRLWTNVYPRDTLPLENLANAYLQLGQPNEALRMAQASIRLAPSSSAAYALESRAYLSLGRYGELNKLCSDPARNNSRMMPFHASCWLGAFAQGNSAAQQKELAWAQESPQRSVMLEYAAWGDLYQGKAKQAAATFDEARRSTAAGNMTEFVAELDLDEALLDADTGLDAEAQQHALHALQVGPGSGYVQAAAALALARSGDTDRARLELRKAASQVMGNATLDKPLLASVRAAIALQEHNPEAAVQQMQAVRAFDDVAFMTLSPAYYRGLALLDLRHYAAADAAFRGVIAHRMLYPESVYSKLAQLSLGRSLMLEGKSAEAQEQFRELDARWKDADPGFAPLQELQVWKSSPRSR